MIRTVALAVLSLSLAAAVASAAPRSAPDRGGWWGWGGNTHSAPELDPGSVMSGLTLLLGGLTILRAGRRKDN